MVVRPEILKLEKYITILLEQKCAFERTRSSEFPIFLFLAIIFENFSAAVCQLQYIFGL